MVKQFGRFVCGILPVILMTVSVIAVFAQTPKPTPAKPQPTPKAKGVQKPTTAEQVAETSIFFYAGGGPTLDQIRKTTTERGQSTLTAADGRIEKIKYHRFVIRGETLTKERVRLDQEFPTATFSLVFGGEKTFGIFKNTVFPPREDAVRGFENQIFHGVDALLRYRANESRIELAAPEKLYGVEFYVVDVTDKQGRKTRFYISAKYFRVMMLAYDDAGVRYRRKFYDYRYPQGTLVPFRSVLWANDKIVEETEIGTITFGQKVDEDLFKAS